MLDLHCVLEDGSEVDVEIQGKYYKDEFVKRSVYYASKLVSESLGRGKNYVTLPHSYQITFMNFRLLPDERLHHTYLLREANDGSVLTELMQLHFIELPKLQPLLEKTCETLSDLEFWSIIILAGADENIQRWLSRFREHTEELTMAKTLLQRLRHKHRNWAQKLSYERTEHDWTSRWLTGIDDARDEGYKSGHSDGLAEGDYNARLETARRMKANGMAMADIALYTQLSLNELAQL